MRKIFNKTKHSIFFTVFLCAILLLSSTLSSFANVVDNQHSSDVVITDANGNKISGELTDQYQWQNQYGDPISNYLYIITDYDSASIQDNGLKIKNQSSLTYKYGDGTKTWTSYDDLNAISADTKIMLSESYNIDYQTLSQRYKNYTFDPNWTYACISCIYYEYDENTDSGIGYCFYFVFKTGEKESVDKNALEAAIAAALNAETDQTYYHTNDRYNGTDTSAKGFWADMEAVVATARKVNENPLATQEDVNAATASLNRENKDSALSTAISKLIPKKQINPTSLYEAVHPTWVWDYSQTSDDKVHDKDKLVSMKKIPVSAENCTDASWKAYTKAKEAAEDYLNSLFDGERKPTAANVNDEAGTAQKNAEALVQAADPQQLVRKSLYETYYNHYLKYREEAGLLLEQYNPEKLTQGDYDAASWDSYTKAYDTLNKTYRHKPSGGTKEDYGIYKAFGSVWDEPSGEWLYQTDALTATYNRLKTTGAVTVSFTYVNNLTASYPALSGGTDAYQKEEITLTGETNVYGLLKEAKLNYASDISGIHRPETESGNIMPDKSFKAPYFAIFVDGEFRGIYAGEEKAKSVNLKNGNKVTVARVLQPQILNEASSGMDSTDWFWGDASRSEYQESLAMISVNPEKSSTRVGDKLTVSAAVTDAFGKDLGKKKSAEGLTLFVSEPSENPVITSPGKNTGETTDTSGKASYTFARSGWYTIALHDVREDDYTRLDVYQNYTMGTYHSLVAGDIALIYVGKPENEQALIAQYRKENLAKAKELFEQYQEYDFEDGYYKERFTTCYTTLQEHQKSAETFADLMERFNDDYEALQKEAKENVINYEAITKTITEKLPYIPEDVTTLDESYTKAVNQIQSAYRSLSAPQDEKRDAYQKRFFTAKELEKLKAIEVLDTTTFKKLADVTIKVDGFTKLPLAVGIGQTGGSSLHGWPQLTWSMAPNPDGSLPAPTWSSLNYQSEFTAKAGDHAFVRAYLATDDEKYWMVWSVDGENWSLAEPQTLKSFHGESVSGYFLAEYPIPKDIETNEITISVKMVSKAEYEKIADPTGTPEQLQAAKTAAQESLKAAYEGYQNSALKSVYQSGYDSIEAAQTMADVAKARKAAMAALAAAAASSGGSSGEPGTKPTYDSGKTVGKVFITVENTNYSGGAFTGQLVNGWYDLGEKDTMMTCVLKALDQKGYGWDGTKDFDKENPLGNYTITYLASIEKDGKTLGEFDGSNGSGWMGTLNDWFVNESFAAFSVKDGRLENGDTIRVMFTLNYGVDIGGTWGNSNTKLDKLTVTGGTLSPSFSGDNTEYTLVITGDKDGKANVTVKPEAVNKNYQARIFLNSYNKDSARYKMTETISVKSGDILYVGVGEKGWPTMNASSVGTKYTIKVVSGSDASAVKKMIAEIKTITYSNYRGEKGKVEAARAAYNALTDKNSITAADVKKLTDAEAQIKFYTEIDDAKAKLAALPKLTNPTQAQANAYRSQINEATAAYKKLSEEQQKYITKADLENYNALAKALGVSTIVGADAAPESPVETTGKAGSAVTTSPAEVKVSGTTGAVTVKADNQKEILKQAKEKKSAQVVLVVANSDAKGAEKLELNLEKSFLESLLKDTSAKLVVKTPLGQKTYERDELQKLVNETTGTTVKAEINKDNVDTAAEEPTDDNAAKIEKAKSIVKDMKLVARSSKTAKKNVKAVLKSDAKVKASIKELKDLGFTVKYRFYRSTKKAASYKSTVTKKTASYTNTSGKKGTKYFYKVQVRVYDEKGKLAAKTALKQCKYASRTWTR